MVRFSSNAKRPKAVVKHNSPAISKEAPPTIQSTKQKQHRNRTISAFTGHAHTRSLPSNPHQISVIPEIGLTSEQAIKRLIEEIDRVLLKHEKSKKNQICLLPFLRYFSLFLISIWKQQKTWSFGLFCSLISGFEAFFIEFLEKNNSNRSVSNSIKEIRNNLRKLDKSILSGTIQPNSLYSTVSTLNHKTVTKYFFCLELQCANVIGYKLYTCH